MGTEKEIQIIKIPAGISNAYIIKKGENSLMIDTGDKGLGKIESIFHSNNINYRDIFMIVITHTHKDHVNLLYDLNKKLYAEIVVHKDGEEFLKFGQSPDPKNGSLPGKLIYFFSKLFGNNKFKPVVPDTTITGDYFFDKLGFDIRIIYTPGHTKDSLSVIIDKKYAFVGDTLFTIFPRTITPMLIDNKDDLISSWEKLLDLKCDYYFPGHGRKISYEKFLAYYKKFSTATEQLFEVKYN